MFVLRKEWQDYEDGIEAVIIHWAVTLLGKEPCWEGANQVVMVAQPATFPVVRRCSIWVTPPLPSQHLFAAEAETNDAGFLVHHFFEVIQRGRVWSTTASSQEMRAVKVTQSDHSGECTDTLLQYSLDELEHVQCIPMRLDGLPPTYQHLPVVPDGRLEAEDQRARMERYKLVARLPAPHIFRGQVWGPVGTRLLYAVYFGRQGTYNPFSEGGFWLLKDGGLWEVKL